MKNVHNSPADEISSTSDFCRNFPLPHGKNISRLNLIEHIYRSANPNSKVIYVEGGALSGKSQLLAQYMLEYPSSAIGIFLSPGDNYFYTADFVKLAIYEQMHWLLYSTQSSLEYVGDAEYTKLLLQLQKRARKEPITFLLDGLNEGSGFDLRVTKEILAVLPFSQNEFRFVISGSSDFLANLGLDRYTPRSAPLLPISREEAKIYFEDCSHISYSDVERIRHFCRGVVGQIARFREFVCSGIAVSALLDEREGTLRKLLQFEWDLLLSDSRILDILGYVSYSTQPLNLKKLASLTNEELGAVAVIAGNCRFLEIDGSSDIVSIRSEEERRFIREQLKSEKIRYLEHFISELLKNPKSDDSVKNLPGQLLEVGHHGDLISRLDEEHFVRLLGSEKSLKSLKRHCEIGYTAAKNCKNEAAEIRFALANSVVTGLTFSVGTKNEIQARLRLGERDSAIALALSAPTSEERLQLLATAAKAYHSSNLVVPNELKLQIKSLVDEVDLKSFGNLAQEIACDLLVVDFSLAVEIFDRTLSNRSPSIERKIAENTQSSIAERDSTSTISAFDKVHERLSEHHKQRFADAVATMVERISPEDILTRFKSAEVKHQLFVAKQWLKRRRKDPAAWKVADHALSLTLGDLTRPPRIQDFREIAVVLPYITDRVQLEKLVKRINAQIETHLSFGTNVESVRLRMSLIRATHSDDPHTGDADLIELFSEIHEIREVSIRAACWAWMLYGVQKLPDPEAVNGRTTVVTEIAAKLIESIEQLLSDSADHYETAKNAIYGLARANPSMALKLVEKLNTTRRRDKAFATLAKELVVGGAYLSDPGLFLLCVKNIESEVEREKAIVSCLSLMATNIERDGEGTSNKGILNLWRSLRVALKKFSAGVSTYRIVAASKSDTSILSMIAADLDKLWPDIMVDWVRTDAGYSLVRDLAETNREISVLWLERIKDEKRQSRIPSHALGNVLYYTVKIAITSFIIVSPKDFESDDPQFSRLAYLIEAVPVPEYRMILWCDLGIGLYYRDKRNAARMICAEFIQPKLQEEFDCNEAVRDALISIAAPLLFLNNAPAAKMIIEKIHDSQARERAYLDICDTIFRRRSLNDPYKCHEAPGYEIDSDDVASILSVLDDLRTDSMLFTVIGDLCESLASKRNSMKIRRSQVRDFLTVVDGLIDKRLPDPRNIKHDGYKLAAKANVLKARATFESVAPAEWEKLYIGALDIDNVADRVVVLTMIGVCAKNKGPFLDKKWLNIVKKDMTEIPSDADRIDRYSWIAELLEPTDKQFSLAFLQDAMSLSNHLEDGISAFEKQKRILDLAHSIDESLVDKIIDMTDSDEAKAMSKKDCEEHLKLKDGKKELAANPSKFDLSIVTPEELSRLCHENWASLCGGRIFLKPVEDFSKLAEAASRMPMSLAFPVWGWIIENAVRRSGNKSKAERLLQDTCEAACRAAELLLALIGQSVDVGRAGCEAPSDLIRPGERDQIFHRIRRWAEGQQHKVIRISDPYFGPAELDVVHCIGEASPTSSIRVLTCRKHLKDVVASGVFDEAFHDAWKNLCELSPPATEIVVTAWGSSGSHPVHDRWIFTEDSGLRLGGSTNSMGYSRLSEISDMDASACLEKCSVIDELLDRKKKEWSGEKVASSSFDLY